ncbi:hypothetical protein [Bacillus sp. FJAT-44742]|uniref:hypothetical protein n=1 Tax=Bacillus sp. FJAT-44742 TaxID=2014005 RepID=UPI000C2466E7|nr:hypothetical protein [Bacillus sp. FJAT-44742]
MNLIVSGIFSAFLFSGQLSAPFSWEDSTPAKEADREDIAGQNQIEEINEREEQSFHESSLEEPELYIDGQRQIYTPFFKEGELFLPLPAAIQALSQYEEYGSGEGEVAEPFDYIKERSMVEEVEGQEAVNIEALQDLGMKASWYDNPDHLHLETGNLLGIEGVSVGDSVQAVDRKFDIHWNTGFGQAADYVGFYGGNNEFVYTDRYGIKRTGQVPDVQFEVMDDYITYIMMASADYSTSKGVSPGDPLSEVQRVYGRDHETELIDGNRVYIYEVDHGSLWFIGDKEEDSIQRIALWDK